MGTVFTTLLLTSCGGSSSGSGSDEGGSSNNYSPRVFSVQGNSLACVEYQSLSVDQEQVIEGFGAVEQPCSRESYLGTCLIHSAIGDQTIQQETIYYIGSGSTSSIREGCEFLGGTFEPGSTSNSEGSSVFPETFVLEGNALACTEYVVYSEAQQDSVEFFGAYVGECTRDSAIASCLSISVLGYEDIRVYYSGDTGLVSAEDVKPQCDLIEGSFTVITNNNSDSESGGVDGGTEEEVDTEAPNLSNLVGVESLTLNVFLSISFISSESGDISMSGDCNIETTIAESAPTETRLSFIEMAPGFYDNCSLTVTDSSDNESEALEIPAFTIVDADKDDDGFADFVEIAYGTNIDNADSNPADMLDDVKDYSGDYDFDNFSDLVEVWTLSDFYDGAITPTDVDNDLIADDFPIGDVNNAPKLLAFRLIETTINIDGSDVDVPYQLTAIDNSSGMHSVSVRLYAPSGLNYYSSHYDLDGLVAPLAGGVNLDANAEFGLWTVLSVSLQDDADNYLSISTEELKKMGFETEFTVTNPNSDTTAPTISVMSLESTVDMTDGNNEVNFSLTVLDDIAGVSGIVFRIASPSGKKASKVYSTSGTTEENIVSTVPLNSYAESGIWNVESITVTDITGNSDTITETELIELGFSTKVTISNNQADLNVPTISAFTIENSININEGNYSLGFSLTVNDDVSGVTFASVRILSPSGKAASQLIYPAGSTTEVINGSITLDEFSESGTWMVTSISVEDDAENYGTLNTAEIQALGFNTEVTVVNE